jgi:hypothetical protein
LAPQEELSAERVDAACYRIVGKPPGSPATCRQTWIGKGEIGMHNSVECIRCHTVMELGYVAGVSQGGCLQQRWAPGEPSPASGRGSRRRRIGASRSLRSGARTEGTWKHTQVANRFRPIASDTFVLIGDQVGNWTSTSVTFEPGRTRLTFCANPGLLGMPPNGSRIRRGEAPEIGVACENPSLDRKQPISLL